VTHDAPLLAVCNDTPNPPHKRGAGQMSPALLARVCDKYVARKRAAQGHSSALSARVERVYSPLAKSSGTGQFFDNSSAACSSVPKMGDFSHSDLLCVSAYARLAPIPMGHAGRGSGSTGACPASKRKRAVSSRQQKHNDLEAVKRLRAAISSPLVPGS
jgi:hypothetical protein